MSWIDELLEKIDYKNYYPKGKSVGSNERNVKCIFHDDKVESCSINLTTGQFYCHACNKKGNVFTWAKQNGITIKKLADQFGISVSNKTIPAKIIDQAHENLIKNSKALKYLKDQRGIAKATAIKFKLGLLNLRLSIPIKSIDNKYVNLRLYKSQGKAASKVISYGTGFGEARLFPIENLYADEILICEGEMDCLLANQLGFNAITPTTGAGTWKKTWNHLFEGKKINICLDIDSAGRKGAENIYQNLKSYASEIKIINLPIDKTEIPKGDFTDYIVNLGNTKKDFSKLIRKTPLMKVDSSGLVKNEIFKVKLSEASNAKYSHKKIEFKSLISGKDIQPYIIPKEIKINCRMNSGKMCDLCNMVFVDGEQNFKIQIDNPDFLMFLDSDNHEKYRHIKKMAQIPSRCNAVNVSEIDNYNIERLILAPEIQFTTNINEDDSYVTRTAYFLGHNIDSNRVYDFSGITIPHPKTQQATHILDTANPALTAIEGFEIDDKIIASLKKFQKTDYPQIYDDTIMPHTGIKGRLDLFTVIFLSYCSPLHFEFDGRMINKGWLETLILGDTRTGKTEMAKSLIEFFQVGELVLGESASFAGLIGGLQQMGNRWHLNWGRIPLNNKRLVFVDELSGLPTWDIGKLSGIRSSGIAEITKIRTERTHAKTRVIWMSNVRGTNMDQKDLMAYTQGIRAVPELIGKQEDISRFDLVLLLSQSEVSADEINKPINSKKNYKFKGIDFHNLIMWCWKLQPGNIKISKEAMDLIFTESKKLGNKYSQSIPIVISSEQRIKLARISAAVACTKFSTPDGINLNIEAEHVQFASEFLQQILDKPVSSYDEYSKLEKSRLVLKNEDKMEKFITPDVIDQLLDMDRFSFSDIQDIFGIDLRSEARKTISALITNQALKRSGSNYEKTPAFISFMRKLKMNGNGKIKNKPEIAMENDNEEEWIYEDEN